MKIGHLNFLQNFFLVDQGLLFNFEIWELNCTTYQKLFHLVVFMSVVPNDFLVNIQIPDNWTSLMC